MPAKVLAETISPARVSANIRANFSAPCGFIYPIFWWKSAINLLIDRGIHHLGAQMHPVSTIHHIVIFSIVRPYWMNSRLREQSKQAIGPDDSRVVPALLYRTHLGTYTHPCWFQHFQPWVVRKSSHDNFQMVYAYQPVEMTQSSKNSYSLLSAIRKLIKSGKWQRVKEAPFSGWGK